MPIVRRSDLIVFCMILLLAVMGCRTSGKPTGKVSFAEPKDGATVTGPVKSSHGGGGNRHQTRRRGG